MSEEAVQTAEEPTETASAPVEEKIETAAAAIAIEGDRYTPAGMAAVGL